MATAKRFKLKIPSVISNPLQFCRFKDPSSFPINPGRAIYRLSPTNPKAVDISFPILPTPPLSTPQYCYPSITKRHGPSKIKPTTAHEYCNCRCGSRLSPQLLFSDYSSEFADFSTCRTASFAITEKYYIKHEKKEDVIQKKKKKKKAKAQAKARARGSTTVAASLSSTGKSTTTDWFSIDGDECRDSESLIDSLRTGQSGDSSCESSTPSPDTSFEKPNDDGATRPKKMNGPRRLKRRQPSVDWRGSSSSSGTGKAKGAVAAATRTMGRTTAEVGKAKESFAVVKRSADPYGDFKRSMLEMIMEKQMFEARELEELLQCFLTLNSRQYHAVIVDAFSEIWEVLFCDSSVKHRLRV